MPHKSCLSLLLVTLGACYVRAWAARGLADQQLDQQTGPQEDTADAVGKHKPPRYADTFELTYNFSLPYERRVQVDGLNYRVHVWRDYDGGSVRVDTYEGTNSLITTKKQQLEVVPRIDRLVCMALELDEGDVSPLDAPLLPDVSAPGWEYAGKEDLDGQKAHLWQLEETPGAKHVVYRFYAARDGSPLRLHMHGNDLLSGSHFDEYQVDYGDYRPGPLDPAVFKRPEVCKDDVDPLPARRSLAANLRWQQLLPYLHYGGDEVYDRHLMARPAHRRRHGSAADYAARVAVFHANRQLVEEWNSGHSRSYDMALNHFADWTQEEFEAVMLPRHGQSAARNKDWKPKHEVPYKRLLPKERIPTALSWRGTGADGPVKDQAACGSCWAFGATGTLHAAHYFATGKELLLSEQEMMDCSWEYGANMACDGGDYDAAIDWLVDAGGLAGEAAYEYLGQDGFCRANATAPAARFAGFAYVPPSDDDALMEAVASRGPIAVSIDAAQPGFRFYSSGVYDAPTCMWKPDDLDHAVTLVGYGTHYPHQAPQQQAAAAGGAAESGSNGTGGVDFWLIRNSWSPYWGDDGYVKIARGHHACGVTTVPVYAIVEAQLHNEPVASA